MKKFFLFCLLLFSVVGIAQTANDCVNAIVVCGNSVITSNVSGFGTQELDNTANPCEFREFNSLWLQLNIDRSGTLEFLLTPDDTDIVVDYDFFIYGPDFSCDNFTAPIRCSTTNPARAGLTSNLTGLRPGETDVSEGPGALGNSFIAPLPVLAGETYYLLIDRPEGSGGFSLDWLGSSDFIDPPPIIGEPDPIEVCFADSDFPLDLTQNENQIATDPGIAFEYYESRENAFDGVQEISDPTAYFGSSSSSIYVKATSGNSCFEILEQKIETNSPFSANLQYTLCDMENDGTEAFQLQPIFDEITVELQNPTAYNVSLHANENDADNDLAPLTATAYNSPNGFIYARIASATDTECFLTIPITLNVVATPVAQTIELAQCDIDIINSTDGITTFNLERIFDSLTETEGYDYSFYENEALRDSDTEINDITNYMNTTPFAQTLYYKIDVGSCESFGEIKLEVFSTTVELNDQSPLISCYADSEDGILSAFFDLDTFRSNAFPDTAITIHNSLEDAYVGQNSISGQISSGDTSVFIRIEDDDQCPSFEKLQLVVNTPPEIGLEKEFYICSEAPELNIAAPEGFESYSWLRIDQNMDNEIATTPNIVLTEIGEYRLTVEKLYDDNGQSLRCSYTTDFNVLPSDPLQITEIILGGSSGNTAIEIRVSGDGDYEYSLDGITYTDNNTFENVLSGSVTVFVRDKNGCGAVQEKVSVFGYPKFFTPNGDAVNDFWQIIGADVNSSTMANISIYDRYGKLMGILDPLSQGWDGTYKGRPLPESDYWFKFIGSKSRVIKGHFSLKR